MHQVYTIFAKLLELSLRCLFDIAVQSDNENRFSRIHSTRT